MDKKSLLSSKLSEIMLDFKNQIKNIVDKNSQPVVKKKSDGTPVTQLDLALSALLEQIGHENFLSTTIYSEENYSEFKFPLLAIDPLDGTKEYILHRPEWAISIGHFEKDSWNGEGWIYNPMTDELFDDNLAPRVFKEKNEYLGEVSHSEWDKGLFKNFQSEKYHLSPMGSIAYKLGRLAAGKSDFVISLAPKNIWDIAGGTLLCEKRGIKFYSQGKKVTQVQELYLPPLIWSFGEISEELLSISCCLGTNP